MITIPPLPPDLLDHQIALASRRKPTPDYSPYSVEISTVYMSEDEAREASRPLGLHLFAKRPRPFSAPAICVYTRRPLPPLVRRS